MPAPTSIDQLSTTAAANYPQGSDSPSTLDDVQRAHGSFIALLRNLVGMVTGTYVPATAIANMGLTPAALGVTPAAIGASPQAVRVDVATVAGVIDLTANAPSSNDVRFTGALAVTGFTVAAGRDIFFVAGGAMKFVNGAGLVTNTGADVQFAAGDSGILRATASNVVELLCYSSVSTVFTSRISLSGAAAGAPGYGSTNNRFRVFSNVDENVGSDLALANSATAGCSITVNTAGRYAIKYVDNYSASDTGAITINDPNGTVSTIAAANLRDAATASAANFIVSMSDTYNFPAGTVIRARSVGGNGIGTNTWACRFSVIRVG